MKLWLDAQLPPLLAGWINAQGWGIEAVAVRDLGLRDASDPVIFQAAREAAVVVMTKDRDFIRLLDEWRFGRVSPEALTSLASGAGSSACRAARHRRPRAGSTP